MLSSAFPLGPELPSRLKQRFARRRITLLQAEHSYPRHWLPPPSALRWSRRIHDHLCRIIFGLTLLAASALVTLPLQAVVAIYCIGRRLRAGAGDLFAAMVNSAIVVALSGAGAMVMTTAEPSGLTVPVVRLAAAASGALAGWCIGLVATQHPLLGHIRVMSKDMISAAGRLGRGWR